MNLSEVFFIFSREVTFLLEKLAPYSWAAFSPAPCLRGEGLGLRRGERGLLRAPSSRRFSLRLNCLASFRPISFLTSSEVCLLWLRWIHSTRENFCSLEQICFTARDRELWTDTGLAVFTLFLAGVISCFRFFISFKIDLEEAALKERSVVLLWGFPTVKATAYSLPWFS